MQLKNEGDSHGIVGDGFLLTVFIGTEKLGAFGPGLNSAPAFKGPLLNGFPFEKTNIF